MSPAASGPTSTRSTSAGENHNPTTITGTTNSVKRRVEHEQTPRLPVEVAHRAPQRRADAHPFTPAAVTPAMKYRWAATKSSAIGMIEITLAAISCGQGLVLPMKLESPTVSV